MRKREFERYYQKYLPSIKGIARKLARRDDELALDLEQEGALTLLKLDPRLATTNESAWIRAALSNRMKDYLRKNRPDKYESLDARLDCGDQLERLEETGELKLFTSRAAPPRLHEEETSWESLDENEE